MPFTTNPHARRRVRWISGLVFTAMLISSVWTAPRAQAAGNDVIFSGGGYGHGVGMSQYGAQGQALIDGHRYKKILRHYYTGATVADLEVIAPASPMVIYNKPLWLGAVQSASSVEFVARNGTLSICHSQGNCPKAVEPQEDQVWTLRVKKPGICIFEIDGVKQGKSGRCKGTIRMVGDARIELPGIGKVFGHGKLRIRPVGDSATAERFHISFSMGLQEYLLGIAEMPNSWEKHALRAQAVAARSYAVARAHQREPGTRSGGGINPAFTPTWKDICWCHVRATTADQAYAGWAQSQNPSWAGAVDHTKGEIMTHPNGAYTEDGVVTTFYSSSSGGTTESNVGGFGSVDQYPYLVPVDDHWGVDPAVSNPFASWEKSVPAGLIVAELAAADGQPWGIEFNVLTGAEIQSVAPEAIVRFTGLVNGVEESVDVPGWWLRGAFGLRSPSVSGVEADLDGPHGQTWSQDTGTIEGPAETGDRFGAPLATGDFDGDGHPDIAAGAPRDGVNAIPRAGIVNVIYGSPGGLTDQGNGYFYQNTPGVANKSESGDRFGSALAAGDFDGDGFDDLAIGVPGENLSGVSNAGLVHIFWGSNSGLQPSGDPLRQGAGGIPGSPQAGDSFGATLAAGDFDGDGRADLAIGRPGESISGRADAGSIVVVPGSASGLDVNDSLNLHQDKNGVPSKAEIGDAFGVSLASGDLDGDGRDDLAVGSVGESLGGKSSVGAVHVFFGGANGLRPKRSDWVHQDTSGISGSSQAGDHFGAAIVFGELTGNGRAELVIGIPGENLDGKKDAGRVVVIRGRSNRDLSTSTALYQGKKGAPGTPQGGDRLGETVVVFRMTTGRNRLAVGVPGEDVSGEKKAGLVLVIAGGPGLLKFGNSFSLKQGGLPDSQVVEAGDGFGTSLAAADFDSDGWDDLVIGSPGEDWGAIVDAGVFSTIDNLE